MEAEDQENKCDGVPSSSCCGYIRLFLLEGLYRDWLYELLQSPSGWKKGENNPPLSYKSVSHGFTFALLHSTLHSPHF